MPDRFAIILPVGLHLRSSSPGIFESLCVMYLKNTGSGISPFSLGIQVLRLTSWVTVREVGEPLGMSVFMSGEWGYGESPLPRGEAQCVKHGKCSVKISYRSFYLHVGHPCVIIFVK